MNISKAARADFQFFVSTDLDMIGVDVGIEDFRDDPSGHSALECWFQRDTYGNVLSCREIETLKKAERGKQSWNLQIKLWAEDVAKALLTQEELVAYCHGCPAWIFDATMKFAHLMALQALVREVTVVTEIKACQNPMLHWFFKLLGRADPCAKYSVKRLVQSPDAEFVKGYEKRRLGPRFARLETLFGNVWLPHMDQFDPSI